MEIKEEYKEIKQDYEDRMKKVDEIRNFLNLLGECLKGDRK